MKPGGKREAGGSPEQTSMQEKQNERELNGNRTSNTEIGKVRITGEQPGDNRAEQPDGWTDGWMDGRIDGRTDGGMNGQTDGWKWMDGWMLD